MALAETAPLTGPRSEVGDPGQADVRDPGQAEVRDAGHSAAACRERGCSATGFVRCEYVDSHGVPCGTRWCHDHSRRVGEHSYCRRHAATVAALGAKGRDPRALPPVGNRGASLVSWVFTEGFEVLNGAVTASLRCGEVVFEDHSVNVSRAADGLRRWEQGWRIGDRQGIVRKVTLRVDESDDALVAVVEGDRVIARGVPPWITRRRRGDHVPAATDATDRSHFYAFLAGFVRRSLSAPPSR